MVSFLSLLTRLKDAIPFERRNRTRSLSSAGPLKNSSMRPADLDCDAVRSFAVIAIDRDGMKTKVMNNRWIKLSIAYFYLKDDSNDRESTPKWNSFCFFEKETFLLTLSIFDKKILSDCWAVFARVTSTHATYYLFLISTNFVTAAVQCQKYYRKRHRTRLLVFTLAYDLFHVAVFGAFSIPIYRFPYTTGSCLYHITSQSICT